MNVTVEPAAPSTPAWDSFSGAAHFFKGRVALYAILKALGIGPGDAVVVPGYTCVVVPAAVHFLQATPLFADIDPATYNAAAAEIAAAAEGRPVKALVVQHTYGLPADMGPILRWAEPRGIPVIEDCCHVLGSRYRVQEGGAWGEERGAWGVAGGGREGERPETANLPSPPPALRPPSFTWSEVGRLGDAAFYSSQWSKPFTTGLGGWATARDETLQRRLRQFEQQCAAPGLFETAALTVQIALYRALFRPRLFWVAQDALRRLARWKLFVGSSESEELAMHMPRHYAKRMWRLGPSVARRALQDAPRLIEHRRRLKTLYDSALEAAGLPVFHVPDYADPVLLRYPVRVPDKRALLAAARRRHVELGDWFDHPLHPAGADVAALGWRPGLCPAAEQAAAEVVNLPMHPRINEQQVDRAVGFLAEHLR